MTRTRFAMLSDDDRLRGQELSHWFGDQIFYVSGKGWLSLPRLVGNAGLAGGAEHPLNDLDHDVVLSLRAEAIKNSIVDAARVNAQALGRDRRFRVLESAGNDSFNSGDVATVGERQLDGEIAGQSGQELVHQLGRGKIGLKVGHVGHRRLSSWLVARIKAFLRGGVE